ncbi:hypothetical protein SmJEL517_g00105 [Synchytrium microbalum]|uniref:NodB homology domain-containing protein n=1 Tax=Synchytrium microbalum TaxID=1806994 RepID=A0A507CAM6_9FUNG|nr:uncharacterized protein SmJEL517_g00105 [Synchytrium microbalum]TPX38107.1 hypothetical protein SmJEL517_g00105 [Synchytrium microbalum]
MKQAKKQTTKAPKSKSWPYALASCVVLGGSILFASTDKSERFARALGRRQTVAAPPIIPAQPAAYPSSDESLFITGSYLNDPIVTSALAYINSVVPASLLNIAPSKYIQDSSVTYSANAATNCYWPSGLCTRTAAGAWGAADIVYCPQSYQWGLTYDDAPSENIVNGVHVNDTVSLMNQLDSMNIKATFFVTGSESSDSPASLSAIATRNHHVAHHSWSHHPFTSLTNTQVVAEMMYTAAIIYKNTGLSVRYFRPPYGDIDDRIRGIVNALGYRIVMWDGKYDSTDADVSANAANFAKVEGIISGWFNTIPGFISLQHTIDTFTSGTSIAALKKIQSLGGIKNQMMPVPQCLGDTQWYKNAQVTTVWNSCTIPGGCGGVVASPVASPVASAAPSPVASTIKASAAPSPVASTLTSAAPSPVASTLTSAAPSPVASTLTSAAPSPVASTLTSAAPSPVASTLKSAAPSPVASTLTSAAPSPVASTLTSAAPASPNPSTVLSSAAPSAAPSTVVASPVASIKPSTTAQSPVASAAPSTAASPVGLPVTSDGSCGAGTAVCGSGATIDGPCCSQYGWCGTGTAYCGNGCQAAFSYQGTCGAASSPVASAKGSAAASPVKASPSASAAPASPSASTVKASPVASPIKASPSASAPAPSSSSVGLPLTSDGSCGAGLAICGDGNNTDGPCCSKYGWCGSGTAYCGTGCQAAFSNNGVCA